MPRTPHFLLHLLLPLLLLAWPAPGHAQANGKPVTDADLQKLGSVLSSSDNYKARIQAAKILGALRRDEALPFLLSALQKDTDHLVRSACAWALGAINHPYAIPALQKASETEVALVKKQAGRALRHILASLPENLRSKGPCRVTVAGLKDRVNKEAELTQWVQQYFVEKLLLFDHIELGEEMNISDGEEPDTGERPDKPEDRFTPTLELALRGGISKIAVPEGRAAGPVEVTLVLSVHLMPGGQEIMALMATTGTAPFAGGPKPDDAWEDDPLIEAEKVAAKAAVETAFESLAQFLKLKP